MVREQWTGGADPLGFDGCHHFGNTNTHSGPYLAPWNGEVDGRGQLRRYLGDLWCVDHVCSPIGRQQFIKPVVACRQYRAPRPTCIAATGRLATGTLRTPIIPASSRRRWLISNIDAIPSPTPAAIRSRARAADNFSGKFPFDITPR